MLTLQIHSRHFVVIWSHCTPHLTSPTCVPLTKSLLSPWIQTDRRIGRQPIIHVLNVCSCFHHMYHYYCLPLLTAQLVFLSPKASLRWRSDFPPLFSTLFYSLSPSPFLSFQIEFTSMNELVTGSLKSPKRVHSIIHCCHDIQTTTTTTTKRKRTTTILSSPASLIKGNKSSIFLHWNYISCLVFSSTHSRKESLARRRGESRRSWDQVD